MKQSVALIGVVLCFAVTGTTYAQESTPHPGKMEVTIIPGGFTHFTSKGSEPGFWSYDLVGAFAYNFNSLVGAEGELGGSFGIEQGLNLVTGTIHDKSPNMLSYTGNVIVHVPFHRFVPYASGGIGGLTLAERQPLGVLASSTFFTGNVGGGLKWYAAGGRWGLRGDYRFEAVRSKDAAPDFFGQDTRYGHRVYGGVVVNLAK